MAVLASPLYANAAHIQTQAPNQTQNQTQNQNQAPTRRIPNTATFISAIDMAPADSVSLVVVPDEGLLPLTPIGVHRPLFGLDATHSLHLRVKIQS